MTDTEKMLINELVTHDVDKDSCVCIAIKSRQMNVCAEMLAWLKANKNANQEEIFAYLFSIEKE